MSIEKIKAELEWEPHNRALKNSAYVKRLRSHAVKLLAVAEAAHKLIKKEKRGGFITTQWQKLEVTVAALEADAEILKQAEQIYRKFGKRGVDLYYDELVKRRQAEADDDQGK